MGYVAVKGGSIAIEESIKRLNYERIRNRETIDIKQIDSCMKGLVDQVISEASLYSRYLASLALKQSQGNIEESVFLLRAYRSTLPRKHYSNIVEPSSMRIKRRISASFKDIAGGQILGAAYDYTHRLLDFSLKNESELQMKNWLKEYEKDVINPEMKTNLTNMEKVVDYLRKDNLIKNYSICNEEPSDITKENMEFPTNRSQRLQSLTRGQSGAVTSLGYSALRTSGVTHPTVGELRVGDLPITIENPLSTEIGDEYYIGDIEVTEVEMLIPVTVNDKNNDKKLEFEVGYGICYGQNESKAIAMSILDHCLEAKNPNFPTGDEEFVLMSIDSVESSGFISHLKLPHYVTFSSELDSVRKTHQKEDNNE